MFIDPNARIEVTDESGRVIVLRKQLNQAQRGAIMNAAVHLDMSGGEAAQDFAVGSFQFELLKQYVTDWRGPELPKFDAALIINLDADDALVKQAAERAAELWTAAQKKADPKG
jgi:hypothetical protein